MISKRQLTTILELGGALPRDFVSPIPGVQGEPVPSAFITTCLEKRAGPYDVWLKYAERCTGKVPWNLPGRSATVPLLGAAIGTLAGMVPGGQAALGLLTGGSMNGGFEQPTGIGIGGGVGVGICPPGTRCVGASAFGACLGTCVPTGVTGPSILPPGGTYIGPVYGGNGQVVAAGVGKKRRRMNYSNQKALRRALRRATGYARQQKAIKKVASEFAREFGPKRSPRRDVVVPRHVKVR